MSYEKAQFGLDIRRWRTKPRMPGRRNSKGSNGETRLGFQVKKGGQHVQSKVGKKAVEYIKNSCNLKNNLIKK